MITEDDLTDRTLAARDSVLKVFRSLRYEGIYTPPDVKGTLLVPGSRGGSEWGGAAYDPDTHIIYINANESPEIARVKRAKKQASIAKDQTVYQVGKKLYLENCANCHGADRKGAHNNPSLIDIDKRLTQDESWIKIEAGGGRMPGFGSILDGHREEIIAFLYELDKDKPYRKRAALRDTTLTYQNVTAYGYFLDHERHPANKPPWGTLNAINLNTGDLLWKVPLGNYPDLQKAGDPPTGTENYGGPVVTAGGLVFIGATRDKKFRAFDKDTGELLWETELPGNGHASPSTYMIEGKQYVVISVTGGKEDPDGYIISYALPE
jgi:quinoprotein glucose dehydrogenase